MFRTAILTTILAGVLPVALAAQDAIEMPYLESAETRYGTLSVGAVNLDGFEAEQLFFNGAPVAGTADAYVDIQAVMPSGEDDMVLISVASGGNACPTLWAFARVNAAGIKVSEIFGTCSEGMLALDLVPGGMTATLASFEADVQTETFTWDGRSFSTSKVYYDNDGAVAAGPGEDVTRWLGRYPPEPFDDASERLRFMTIMSEDEVWELAARVGVGSEITEQEGFIVGEGFEGNSGGFVAAIWGIRIEDGAPFAVFRTDGEAPRFFGLSSEELPRRVDEFLLGP